MEVLDTAGLERRTFGDRALADELLRLFVGQCERLLPIALDDSAKARHEALHTLVGGAAAIGGDALCSLARRLEEAVVAGAPEAAALAHELAEAAGALRTAIDRHLAG